MMVIIIKFEDIMPTVVDSLICVEMHIADLSNSFGISETGHVVARPELRRARDDIFCEKSKTVFGTIDAERNNSEIMGKLHYIFFLKSSE